MQFEGAVGQGEDLLVWPGTQLSLDVKAVRSATKAVVEGREDEEEEANSAEDDDSLVQQSTNGATRFRQVKVSASS